MNDNNVWVNSISPEITDDGHTEVCSRGTAGYTNSVRAIHELPLRDRKSHRNGNLTGEMNIQHKWACNRAPMRKLDKEVL